MTAADREQYDGVWLALAYLCQDCSWIGAQQKQCPKCASAVLLQLTGIINRERETGDAAGAAEGEQANG